MNRVRVAWLTLTLAGVSALLGCVKVGDVRIFHHSSEDSRHPVVAFDYKDNPVIAWSERTPSKTEEIFVKYWNGTTFVELKSSASGGGVSNNGGSSTSPSVAVGPKHLVVAWADDQKGGVPRVFLKKWDTSSWLEYPTGVTTTSAAGYGVSQTKLACESPVVLLDSLGHPIVVWTRSAGSSKVPGIFGTRWDGTKWVPPPGADADGRLSPHWVKAFAPSAALNTLGHLVLAYEVEVNSDRYISVREWTGSAWKSYDLPLWKSSALGSGRHPALALANGTTPVVAWEDDRSGISRIYIAHWDSKEALWKPYGGSLAVSKNTGARNATFPSFTLTSSNTPIVAWRESWIHPGGLVHSLVHSLAWESGAWKSLTGKAQGQLSTAENGNVSDPFVTVDSQDKPLVVWSQRVFLKDTTGHAMAPATADDIMLYWPE